MTVFLWILVGIAIALLAVGALAVWALRHMNARVKGVARRVARLPWRGKLDFALGLLRDERVPTYTRLLAPVLVVYLALPLDLIPDFIPVIGYLDDLLVVLLIAYVVLRSIPHRVLEEHLQQLEAEHLRPLPTVEVPPHRRLPPASSS